MSSSDACAEPALLLSVSRLRCGVGHGSVSRLLQAARRNNQQIGLTGLLVFDGDRFAHLVEGPQAQVDRLDERLGVDTRHHQRRVLLRHRGHATPWFDGWRSGYCNAEDLDPLFSASDLSPREARALLARLVEASDLSA